MLYTFQDLVILALSYATDRFPDLILGILFVEEVDRLTHILERLELSLLFLIPCYLFWCTSVGHCVSPACFLVLLFCCCAIDHAGIRTTDQLTYLYTSEHCRNHHHSTRKRLSGRYRQSRRARVDVAGDNKITLPTIGFGAGPV